MRNAFILLLFLSISFTLSAQRPYRSYKTQAVHYNLLQNNSALKQQLRTAEAHIARYRGAGASTPKLIPIIFHIVHSNEQERISVEQIQSQIEALNRDFALEDGQSNEQKAMSREGFDERLAEETYIRFCIGEIFQENQLQNGVLYIPSLTPSWQTDDAIKSATTGGSSPILPQNYLNVWVANLADGVSGYAQLPKVSEATDGIVIDYRYFGTMGTAIAPYNGGKTLTHLIGNYLGLFDLWNDQGCRDDYVFDTPVHNAPNYSCPDYRHMSLCHGGELAEMYMNFMDNTDDACLSMFTHGQVRRMQAVLSINQLRGQLGKGSSVCSNFVVEQTLENRSETAEEIPIASTLQLYPNPANTELNIYLESKESHTAMLSIVDATGKEILHQ